MKDDTLHWEGGYKLVELKKSHKQFKYVTEKMMKTLRQHNNGIDLGGYRFHKVYKIQNPTIWDKYTQRRSEITGDINGRAREKRLFHGSPHALKISEFGFDVTKASASGTFGGGVYFAAHSSKSNQYTFGPGQGCHLHDDKGCCVCLRRMLLCRVTVGNVKRMTCSDKSGALPHKVHSIQGVPSNSGLKYPEYVVYHSYQAYPGFLVEYTINKRFDLPAVRDSSVHGYPQQLSIWDILIIFFLIHVIQFVISAFVLD